MADTIELKKISETEWEWLGSRNYNKIVVTEVPFGKGVAYKAAISGRLNFPIEDVLAHSPEAAAYSAASILNAVCDSLLIEALECKGKQFSVPVPEQVEG